MSAFSDFMDGLPDGAIGVAVSGGSDSVAVLVLAVEWARKSDRTVLAATVDHGLRDASGDEAAGVAKLCARLGVGHNILRWDGVHSGNTQDAARRARQRLIGAWARENGLATVASGHTRDDQAETFLLRLKRGSGVDGLAGMAPQIIKDDVLWVRPVLGARRAELREMLSARGVGWIDDPSNDDLRFDRVKIRNALEMLDEIGLSVDVLADTAGRMQTARGALEAATLAAARQVAEPREIGSVRLNVAVLRDEPREIQLRLLAHTLRWISGAEYRPRLNGLKLALMALLDGHGHTLAGCLIAPKKDGIAEVSREPAAMSPSDAQTGGFDGRWACDVAEGVWRPLGEDGLQQRPDWREVAEHRNSLLSSPSLWYNNELKSAPFVDKYSACKCKLRTGPESFFATIVTH